MTIDYTGKVVGITGAGGALGRSMAVEFAKCGAVVAVCDIAVEAGLETVREIKETGGKAEFFKLDVSSKENAVSVASDIEAVFGPVNIWINNAGINVPKEERKTIEGFSDIYWERITKIDLDGTYICSKAVIPSIERAGGGNIINIGSVIGLVAFRNQCAFAAAKAGVAHLTKVMALELAPKNIRVNCIAPGSILMEGTRKAFYSDKELAEEFMSHIPQKKPGEPIDIANGALYLASDTLAGYVTGHTLTIDGGWTCGFARSF